MTSLFASATKVKTNKKNNEHIKIIITRNQFHVLQFIYYTRARAITKQNIEVKCSKAKLSFLYVHILTERIVII